MDDLTAAVREWEADRPPRAGGTVLSGLTLAREVCLQEFEDAFVAVPARSVAYVLVALWHNGLLNEEVLSRVSTVEEFRALVREARRKALAAASARGE